MHISADSVPQSHTAPRVRIDDEALRLSLLRYMRAHISRSDDAEDLVQDALLRMWNRTAVAPVADLAAYSYRTAASVLIDHHRRQNVRLARDHVEFDPERHGGTDVDAQQLLEDREALQRAAAVVGALGDRTRTILVMRRLEGFAYAEIANCLGISVSAVEKHIVRATCKLAAADCTRLSFQSSAHRDGRRTHKSRVSNGIRAQRAKPATPVV